ncbi:MAG: hypothetical protein P1V51_19000 [Deltaproteobacteria bacterium]|nr:hypothetical protein [Deltaproteobacteria bacterium]
MSWLRGGFVAVVLGLALGAPSPSRAEEDVRYAVLDVQGLGSVETSQVEGLSGLLASEIDRRPGCAVIRSAEIRTMLGFEAQKQLLGCDDGSCLAELGGALGVPYLVQSEVTEVGGTYLITLVLLDVEASEAARRVTREAGGERELVSALRSAVAELMDGPAGAAASNGSGSEGFAEPRRGGGGRTLKWIGLGLGGATAIAGGVIYGGALGTYYKAKSDPLAVTRAQRDAAESRYPLGLGLLGGGAALAIGALLLPSGGPAHAPALTLAPFGDGVYVSLTLPLGGAEDAR